MNKHLFGILIELENCEIIESLNESSIPLRTELEPQIIDESITN